MKPTKSVLLTMSAAMAMMIANTGMADAPANFTADGMKWEPVPTGHAPGKDNGIETGHSAGNEFHFPGEDCGICHTPKGKANDFVFSMAGTIYKDRAGREPLKGAEIILKDAAGKIISMTSNDAGNFYTYAPIASDPLAWRPARTDEDLNDSAVKAAYEKENKENSATWRYKAWVAGNDMAIPMVTVAAVGSSSGLPRMGCGMHHAPFNSRGALLVSGYPTLPSYPETGVSFKKHVMPILKNRCKSCHLPKAANPTANEPNGRGSYDFSGSIDLSAYRKDPNSVTGITEMVNISNPDSSKLLAATMYGAKHAGGASWRNTNDPDYKAIRQWIAEGAKNN